MELKQYAVMLWKWMWLIVLSTGIAAGSSFIVTSQTPMLYQASTMILVGQSIQSTTPNAQDLYTSQQLALTYIQIAKTEPVLQGTLDALKLEMNTDQFRRNVSASIVQGTQLLELQVTDTNPARAQAMANELGHQLSLLGPAAQEQQGAERRAFVQSQVDDLQRQIQEAGARIQSLQKSIDVTASARDLADKQQQIAGLQAQIGQWQLTYANLTFGLAPRSPNYLSVIEPARLPKDPIAPNVPLTVLLAAAIGLVLSSTGALLIEYIDDTIKTPEDVTQSLKLTLLGVIARISGKTYYEKLIAAQHPRSSQAEAYRVLRTNIQVADVDKPIKTLLITSAGPMEGKSVTAANLAVVMAQAGLRVVLIDADMRRPRQQEIFHLTNDFGLTNGLLHANALLEEFAHSISVENLVVITTGPLPPNPAELLNSRRMQSLLARLQDQADMVILDSPPCLPLADAAILARQVDGILIVANSGKTRREMAVAAKEAMEKAGGRVIGFVLNRVSRQHSGYYYHYYYDDDGHRKPKSRSKQTEAPVKGLSPRLTQPIVRDSNGR